MENKCIGEGEIVILKLYNSGTGCHRRRQQDIYLWGWGSNCSLSLCEKASLRMGLNKLVSALFGNVTGQDCFVSTCSLFNLKILYVPTERLTTNFFILFQSEIYPLVPILAEVKF